MSINKASAPQIKGKRKTPKRITPDYLHNSGLYYLQRFAASSAQFRAVMMRKVKRSCLFHKDQNPESCAAMVDELVEKFIRAGLLNDAAFTGGAVASYRRRGFSKQKILSKLQVRGIVGDQATKALAAYDVDNYESPHEAEQVAALLHLRKKRLGAFATKETDREKQLSSLARQGFSYDTAEWALGLNRTQAEDLLNKSRL